MTKEELRAKLEFYKNGRLSPKSSEMVQPTPWKWCGGCKQLLLKTEFGSNVGKPDRLNSHCQKCVNKRYAQGKAYVYIKKHNETLKGRITRRNGWATKRAKKYNAIPPWLTKEHKQRTKGFYKLAIMLEDIFGKEYQIDHIVPYNNPKVCALHVPWNLQILTRKENRNKSNKIIG